MKLLLIALVLFGCGRPTLTELLKDKVLTCDGSAEITLPEDHKRGDKVKIDFESLEFRNCREKQ